MGLDLWSTEDIRNALLAADEASAATAAVVTDVGCDLTTLRAYRAGYKAALATVALAFGLSPAIVIGEQRMVVRRPAEWSIQMMMPEEDDA